MLATPVLAALRRHFSAAKITCLLRRHLTDIIDGCGWHDALATWPPQRGLAGLSASYAQARALRSGGFDVALLLTNSFRSALLTWLAGIPRRVGYARDGRSWLLTDRLRPLKRAGEFVPTPMTPYYAKVAEHVGCPVDDLALRLGLTPAQEAAARRLQEHYGLGGGASGTEGRRYAVINPGAAFGAAKCWLPERFAAVCDGLERELGLRAVIVGAPGEHALMKHIAELAQTAPACCTQPGTSLGSLKGLIRDAALLVCNDTGPRHYGIALGTPTVTIFGPTHQAWTDTGYTDEVKLQAEVECGPCQLRRCPLDHRCMRRIEVEHVVAAARALLERAVAVRVGVGELRGSAGGV